MGSPEEAKRGPSKPSLLSTSDDTNTASNPGKSILSDLENGGKAKPVSKHISKPVKPASKRGWAVALAAIVAVGAGAAALLHGNAENAPRASIAAVAAAPVQAATPKTEVVPVATEAAPPSAAYVASTASAVATTVATAEAPASTVHSDEDTGKVSGLAALIVDDPVEAKTKKADDAPANTTAVRPAAVAVASKKAIAAKEKSRASATTLAAHDAKEKSRKAQAKAVAHATAKAPEKAKPKSPAINPANDSDIALLTAIVAHEKAEPFASLQSTAGSSRKTKPDGRNRDIVERKAGDTTESLLQRCKRLGSLEGDLCRSRICAGHWDTDAACSVSSNPAKVSSANN
ncbi:hypothetical protein [Undibacterium sp.]|uniref:hypothetical protein n=1 Tax=Undibacterium sp. TaxID=1914977 RepID=UPI00374D6454